MKKFIQLHALKRKRAQEVADHQIDIFAIFGAPIVQQSDIDGRELSYKIVKEPWAIWPDLKIVHGKHSRFGLMCKPGY